MFLEASSLNGSVPSSFLSLSSSSRCFLGTPPPGSLCVAVVAQCSVVSPCRWRYTHERCLRLVSKLSEEDCTTTKMAAPDETTPKSPHVGKKKKKVPRNDSYLSSITFLEFGLMIVCLLLSNEERKTASCVLCLQHVVFGKLTALCFGVYKVKIRNCFRASVFNSSHFSPS